MTPNKRPVGPLCVLKYEIRNAHSKPQPLKTPDRSLLGLTEQQAKILRLLCEGNHLFVSGPGGAGKTTAVERYASLIRQARPEIPIYCITPNAKSIFGKITEIHSPASYTKIRNRAEQQKHDDTPLAILIIDEHISMPPAILVDHNLFRQIIIIGDPAQGTFDNQSLVARQLKRLLDAPEIELKTIWRSSNVHQFNVLNALVYGGKYESIGNAGGIAQDPFRTTAGPANNLSETLDLAARTLRTLIANRTAKTTVLCRDKTQLTTIAFIVHAAKIRNIEKLQLTLGLLEHLPGTEADIVITPTSLMNDAPLRDIVKTSIILLGRSRHRTEIRYDAPNDTTFGRWLDLLTSWQYDTLQNHTTGKLYENFAKTVPDTEIIRANLNNLMIINKKTGTGTELYAVLGHHIRNDISYAILAASKKWKVKLIHPAELQIRQ